MSMMEDIKRKSSMSKSRKVILTISILTLLTGIGIMVYPYAKQWLYDKSARADAADFDDWRQSMLEEAEEDDSETDTESIAYLQDLYEAMQAYNLDLYENGQSGFNDAWSYQTPSFDLTEWGFTENIVGYITIEKMDIVLPIYLGASRDNLALGAVHLSQTSLPIGGENTNAVIAAHRGYAEAAMFKDIDKLEIGDEVIISNFWEDLVYQVVEIKIIEPTDTDEVLIQEGKDMITLMTCHPYGTNTYRYVVYCERAS